jgi:hypothetical protein
MLLGKPTFIPQVRSGKTSRPSDHCASSACVHCEAFSTIVLEINGIDAGGETAHGSEEYQARLMTLEPPELIPSNFLT